MLKTHTNSVSHSRKSRHKARKESGKQDNGIETREGLSAVDWEKVFCPWEVEKRLRILRLLSIPLPSLASFHPLSFFKDRIAAEQSQIDGHHKRQSGREWRKGEESV